MYRWNGYIFLYHLIHVDPTGHYDDEGKLLDKEQEEMMMKEDAEESRAENKANKLQYNQQVTKKLSLITTKM